MTESPYRIRGVGIPAMLGRERLFDQLRGHLVRPTPNHVCVVGHRGFGKSVLLNHLASQFRAQSEHYLTSLYRDLRHRTPRTDDEFRRVFVAGIKSALEGVRPNLAGYLDLEEERPGDLLRFVFEELENRDQRLLAVFDGFDHVLAGSGITRNLWDEMRSLCQSSSLRIVTGSRARLRELCRTEDSRTSDFWEVFYDTPLPVGCFTDDDWDGFLSPVRAQGADLDGSAISEIRNWTGGIPVLAVAVADRLFANAREGLVFSKPDVDRLAAEIAEERRDLLAELWEDCPIELQSELVNLATHALPRSEVHVPLGRDLELRGLARMSGSTLRSSCRMIAQYAGDQAGGVENLRRLFGNSERFHSNIHGLLELRVGQIHDGEPELVSYVRRAIRDLRPDPIHSVVWARSIAERALELIWNAELPADRSLPDPWRDAGVTYDENGRFPRSRGRQCQILRVITGRTGRGSVSKFVTKPTSLLVEHVHSVGNFGQHRDGAVVHPPMAIAFCMSAIALAECLARDLSA